MRWDAVGYDGVRGARWWTREDEGGDALDGLDVLGQHAARWFCGTDGRSASRSVDSSDGGSAGCAVVSVVWWARLRGWELGGRGRGESGRTTRWPWRRWLGDEECGVPYRTPYHRIILPAPHGGHHLRELQYRYAGTSCYMFICPYAHMVLAVCFAHTVPSHAVPPSCCALSYGTLSNTVLSLTVPSLRLSSYGILSYGTLSDCTLSHSVYPLSDCPLSHGTLSRCTLIRVPSEAMFSLHCHPRTSFRRLV